MKSWLVAACLGLGLAPLPERLFPIWEYFIIKSKLYSVFFTHQLRKYMAGKLRSQITYILWTRKLLVINLKRILLLCYQSSIKIVENCRIQFEQKIQNLFLKPEGILYYVFLWPFFVVAIFYILPVLSPGPMSLLLFRARKTWQKNWRLNVFFLHLIMNYQLRMNETNKLNFQELSCHGHLGIFWTWFN